MKKEEVQKNLITIGSKFRKERKKRDLSINQVAKESGLNHQQVQAIEDGTANYTIESFLRVKKVLNINPL